MSQFAHGISAVDVNDQHLFDQAPLWMLGKRYGRDDHLTMASDTSEAYCADFEALFWFTYRRDFPRMEPYEYTSDAGWGCMLRTAQMLLAQALQRLMLDDESRKPRTSFIVDSLSPQYTTLLTWFLDSPDPQCHYSIHNMVKLGMRYDKLPGEWYGPTTAAQVLRDLVNLHRRSNDGPLSMYVPQEGVVYSDDVRSLCISHLADACESQNDRSCADSEVGNNSAFFDPLLNPPTNPSQPKDWSTALLILIPLRLGLDHLNECYLPALQKSFEFPQSVGIIGGKRGHSVYFVGTHENRLHLLDPHEVQPSAELTDAFPSAAHLSTVHSSRPLMMSVETVDPSLALGFLCRNREDYDDFCRRVKELERLCRGMCPFSVAERRPDYSTNEAMQDMLTDSALSDASIHESGAEASEDEDYVLV